MFAVWLVHSRARTAVFVPLKNNKELIEIKKGFVPPTKFEFVTQLPLVEPAE
jgi:hypothetical protein